MPLKIPGAMSTPRDSRRQGRGSRHLQESGALKPWFAAHMQEEAAAGIDVGLRAALGP
ncbi:unnamed protein product [marine sediment metagenome]|uniref:Uncharacterized protein n=1 Tax=marine sediment metagenome TaxID=412755 RepID=X0UYF6_9ZZZZ